MKKLLFVALLSGIILNVSCKKETETVAEIAPEIPPLSTFAMDFSNFQSAGKTASDSTYWGLSAFEAGIWNYILYVNLAIPVASFKESFNHKAVYVSDTKEWLWTYTVQAANATYTAKLYAKVSGSDINWRMLLSQSGVYSDFEWYTGVSKTDQTSGTWSLNVGPQKKASYIDIAWSKNSTKSEIKYTNVLAGDEGKGTYINYGLTPGTEFDAFYDIYYAKDGSTTNIIWNKANRNGKVKKPTLYGDSDYRCWGTDLANTVCN